jgi:hypothetical protein
MSVENNSLEHKRKKLPELALFSTLLSAGIALGGLTSSEVKAQTVVPTIENQNHRIEQGRYGDNDYFDLRISGLHIGKRNEYGLCVVRNLPKLAVNESTFGLISRLAQENPGIYIVVYVDPNEWHRLDRYNYNRQQVTITSIGYFTDPGYNLSKQYFNSQSNHNAVYYPEENRLFLDLTPDKPSIRPHHRRR